MKPLYRPALFWMFSIWGEQPHEDRCKLNITRRYVTTKQHVFRPLKVNPTRSMQSQEATLPFVKGYYQKDPTTKKNTSPMPSQIVPALEAVHLVSTAFQTSTVRKKNKLSLRQSFQQRLRLKKNKTSAAPPFSPALHARLQKQRSFRRPSLLPCLYTLRPRLGARKSRKRSRT